MTKTTKRPLPVSKTIQFQQHQKIKDISVSGKDALTSVDFSERDGDFKLKVKADPDKINEVSGTPFVTTSVTTADEGTDDPKKSVALGHDYRGLNLETAGKYLSINKTKDKAVIDGTLIEADLTKALNDAKEAKDKADKAAEKAGLAEQKATTAITQISSVSDALTKLTEASKTADAKSQAEIDKLKAKLETLPKESKLYVSEADKERANSGRLEGLTYVDFYTALDSTDATAISMSENVTIGVTLKPDTENTSGTAFTREVSEIRLDVVQPAVKDWTEEFQTLAVNLEDTQSRAQIANTKAEEADKKAEQAQAKADDLAKKLEDAKTKEVTDIASVTDAVTKLGEASKTADGELKKAIDALAEKLKNANTTNSAEPLRVTQDSRAEILRNGIAGVNDVEFIIGGQTVSMQFGEGSTNTKDLETDFDHRLASPHIPAINGFNILRVRLVPGSDVVASIAFSSYVPAIARKFGQIRDWLKFPPLTPAKALLQLSQAKGRTNFTQDDIDAGVIVSGGLLVDLGEYWLPVHVSVAGASVAFSGNKANAQALLDFDIKTYNTDTAEIETIKASELLEPGTKVPPILKIVY